jgi:DNA-binding NarL/FixJ family response regulator
MVLDSLLSGATDAKIAKMCNLSERTVQRTISELRDIFEVSCRASLIAKVSGFRMLVQSEEHDGVET